MNGKVVTLDVREEIRKGQEPFSKIMATVGQLEPGDTLRLLAPFEPAPLYGVLAAHGFGHESKALPAGDWEILFKRDPHAPVGAGESRQRPSKLPASPPRDIRILEIDARGLEPPQPMVTILEQLAHLPCGVEVKARTDRKPLHLSAQLQDRGFIGETTQEPDGSYVTHIRRA